MIQYHPKGTVVDASLIVAANGLVWNLQSISMVAAIVVSLVSTIWIVAQTIRFIQKWMREEEARKDKAEEVCRLRRQQAICPRNVPPTQPGDLT